jgi:hypothetical protein
VDIYLYICFKCINYSYFRLLLSLLCKACTEVNRTYSTCTLFQFSDTLLCTTPLSTGYRYKVELPLDTMKVSIQIINCRSANVGDHFNLASGKNHAIIFCFTVKHMIFLNFVILNNKFAKLKHRHLIQIVKITNLIHHHHFPV